MNERNTLRITADKIVPGDELYFAFGDITLLAESVDRMSDGCVIVTDHTGSRDFFPARHMVTVLA